MTTPSTSSRGGAGATARRGRPALRLSAWCGAGDVLAVLAAGAGVVLHDLVLVEALLHHLLELHDQFLLLVELLGVRERLDLDVAALDPAERHADGVAAGGQLVAQVHRRRLKALGGGDGGGELEDVLVALGDDARTARSCGGA